MSVKLDVKSKLVEIRETFHKLVLSLQRDQKSSSLEQYERSSVQSEILFQQVQKLTCDLRKMFDDIQLNQSKHKEILSLKKEIEQQEKDISEIIAFISKKHGSINKVLHQVEEQYQNAKNPMYLDVNQVMSYGHKVTCYMSAPVDYPNNSNIFPPCPQPGIDWGKSLLYPHNLAELTKALEEQPNESVQVPLITNMDFRYKFKTQIVQETQEEIELFDVNDSDQD